MNPINNILGKKRKMKDIYSGEEVTVTDEGWNWMTIEESEDDVPKWRYKEI